MNRLVSLTIILAAIVVTSCSKTDLLTGSKGKKNPNLELWESHATEVYKIDQNNLPPWVQNLVFHLTVVNGEVELVIDTNIYITTELFIIPGLFSFFSIEDLFEIIANVPNSKPYQFEVEYDSVYGYPTYLFYDSTVARNNDHFYVTTELIELDAEKPFSYDKRKKWESLEITDYKFEQSWICFCPIIRSALLTVKDNLIESGINLPDSTELTLQEARDNYRTVSKLFYQLDQDFALNRYEAMIVKYDSLMHYPSSVYLDQYLGVADDEFEIVTKGVE